MMALFLIAAGTLFFGLLEILIPQTDDTGGSDPVISASSTLPDAGRAPEQTRVNQRIPGPAPTLAKPTAVPISRIEPPPDVPDKLGNEPQGAGALAVLEKFLAATTLAERLPIIETRTSAAELAASCLAGPLPAAPTRMQELRITNPIEQVVNCYFSVVFENRGSPQRKHTLLVRTRGMGDPKIVADPFLDLFGGRLAAFVAQPGTKPGIFQVIADPSATCLDPKVPEPDQKLTLKLLSSDNTKEIAQAVFAKTSEIGQMLEDGSHQLSYGKPKVCTVMLRWNTTDHPAYPYLEAVQIMALDWNP